MRKETHAALPIACCLLMPLARWPVVGLGYIYLYDILTVLALMKLRALRRESTTTTPASFRRAIRPWAMLLTIGFLTALGSALIRGGINVYSPYYVAQYLLGLAYVLALAEALACGSLDAGLVARTVAWGAVGTAAIGIAQYLQVIVNPSGARRVYNAYSALVGLNWDFDKAMWISAQATRSFRISGTWMVSTTFGGMMALGAGWLIQARMTRRRTWICWCVVATAVVLTLSRHAWLCMVLLLIVMLLRTGRRMMAVAGVAGLVLGISAVASLWRESNAANVMSPVEMLRMRLDRTMDLGLSDSSIQARYVTGTWRFLGQVREDPSILAFGFGIMTEKGLGVSRGQEWLASEMARHHFGFVSNSWLLMLRACGAAGFIGLVGLHLVPLRRAPAQAWPMVALSAIVLVADNYAFTNTRCFLQCLALLALAWGVAFRQGAAVEATSRQIRKPPIPAFRPSTPWQVAAP